MNTLADLRKLADFAISRAKHQLERTGTVDHFVVAMQAPDGEITILPMDRLPAGIMNNGAIKDQIFDLIRKIVHLSGAEAIVIASEAWMNIGLEKAQSLPVQQVEELYNEHGSEWMEQQGYMRRFECIQAVAQNRETVLQRTIEFKRVERLRQISYKATDDRELPAECFGGRMKMFGDPDARP